MVKIEYLKNLCEAVQVGVDKSGVSVRTNSKKGSTIRGAQFRSATTKRQQKEIRALEAKLRKLGKRGIGKSDVEALYSQHLDPVDVDLSRRRIAIRKQIADLKDQRHKRRLR